MALSGQFSLSTGARSAGGAARGLAGGSLRFALGRAVDRAARLEQVDRDRRGGGAAGSARLHGGEVEAEPTRRLGPCRDPLQRADHAASQTRPGLSEAIGAVDHAVDRDLIEVVGRRDHGSAFLVPGMRRIDRHPVRVAMAALTDALEPLLAAVMAELAKRLKLASEETNRIATVRPDMVDDGRRGFLTQVGACLTPRLGGELYNTSTVRPSPSRIAVKLPIRFSPFAALI